jgi:hypothetical protein
MTVLSLSGCDNKGSGAESLPPKNWQVFLGEYETAINEYLTLALTVTNSADQNRLNKMLLTITNLQSMAPKIAGSLSNQELQDFLLRYGKISTRLSESAKSP